MDNETLKGKPVIVPEIEIQLHQNKEALEAAG